MNGSHLLKGTCMELFAIFKSPSLKTSPFGYFKISDKENIPHDILLHNIRIRSNLPPPTHQYASYSFLIHRDFSLEHPCPPSFAAAAAAAIQIAYLNHVISS